MGEFCIKFSILLVTTSLIWLASHLLMNEVVNTKSAEGALFIWGDSQVYRGFDLNLAKKESSLNIFSAARQGAGVYDFLNFVSLVPDGSSVIIAPSIPSILSSKNRDYNLTGLNFFALKKLFENDYSFSYLWEIIVKNQRPRPLFTNVGALYKNTENLQLRNTTAQMKLALEAKDNPTEDKVSLYKIGLNALIMKKCTISIVHFPVHPKLHECLVTYPQFENLSAFYKSLPTIIGSYISDTLIFPCPKNHMKDLVHLNKRGATIATSETFNKSKINQPRIITFLVNECDIIE